MPDLPGVPLWVRRFIYWVALAVGGAGLLAAKLDHTGAVMVVTMVVSVLGQVCSLWYTRPVVRAREAAAIVAQDPATGRHSR